MALIKCPECGKEISDLSEACIHCGYPLHSSKVPPTESVQHNVQNTKPKRTQGKYAKDTKRPFIAGICVSIAVIGLLAIFYFAQSDKAKLDCTETTSTESESTQASETNVCEETETSETIVRLNGKTSEIVNSATRDIGALAEKVHALIKFGEENGLTSMDDIRNYEAKWQELSNAATELGLKLYQNRPSEKYDDDWIKLKGYTDTISASLLRFTNLDVNGDGAYTTEEVSSLITDVIGEVVDSMNEYIAVCEHLLAEAKKEESSTTTNSSSNKAPSSSTSNSSLGTSTSDNAEETNYARHTDSEAWGCAKDIARNSLKSPSTAKFCSFPDAKVTHLGNGKYKVTGWVDAENGFGAKIRQNFTVTYTATSGGYKEGSATFY